MSEQDLSIQHDSDVHRFAATVEGERAYIDYRLDGGVMTLTHTWVPDAIGGRGIAGKLVKRALEHARAEGLRVDPACSYADSWMRRHPDVDDLRVQTA
ncbi:GNAT family N-acetyltransferase [Lysobacter sp. A3-1-A15]|uniref:GNAT family N-acetyltransferase n=1 Tax=Novilysobacter viscosus TaxID=3098602 RepID=UPI002EDB3867